MFLLHKTYEITYGAGYNKGAGRRFFMNIVKEQAKKEGVAQRAWVRLNEKKRYIKNSFKIHYWGANGMFLRGEKKILP